ncbi:hypothetical protein cyc_07518 [Cyclospora cayetanensis]|uniref:Uncharacterized protein n=1 Tax=Cyclospora cayetanensis TaxID=88456 RepID=A0A1D3CZD8_9EIME|nr:hypothetical protein cyc_07518 [Cyclospora cayetanensis]
MAPTSAVATTFANERRLQTKAEATEIRSLVVPIRASPAGSYYSKAEKEQLLRDVTNAVHEAYLSKLGLFPTKCEESINITAVSEALEVSNLRFMVIKRVRHSCRPWRAAVAHEIIVDFPCSKRPDTCEEAETAGPLPDFETIDTALPPLPRKRSFDDDDIKEYKEQESVDKLLKEMDYM